MLELRGEARKFLKLEVGDGRDIHLWFDWWHLNGGPYEKYGYQVVYDAHSKMEARLSTVIREEKWNWRPARSEELVVLREKQVHVVWWNLIWFRLSISRQAFSL
jgi:hypothetical protein